MQFGSEDKKEQRINSDKKYAFGATILVSKYTVKKTEL